MNPTAQLRSEGLIVVIILCFLGCSGATNKSSGGATPPALQSPYVVVLGVAQDGGHPQAGCTKACCIDLAPGAGNNVAAIGVVDPRTAKRWMFDATPSFAAQLRMLLQSRPAAPFSKLAGIFLTHGHIGHYAGLIHVGREVMGAQQLPVFAMKRMRKMLRYSAPWSQLVKLQNISLQGLIADSPVSLAADLSVTPILVPHRDEFTETVGYVIRGPTRALLYVPDIDKWEKWQRNLEDELAKVDVALLDGTFYSDGELPGRAMAEIPHPFIVETCERLRSAPAKERRKVRFIHLNHSNPALRPSSEQANTVRRADMQIARQGEWFSL